MTYEVIGASARSVNFQDRCWGAVISLSSDIIGAVQDSGSIQDSLARDLTTLASKNQALKFAKLIHLSNRETISNLMLLNVDIAANPMTVVDATLQYQTKEIWLRLVEIG